MDNYIVSARKYRPATFRSVIGQEALTTTLKNAIATSKLAHAYLFCGPRGVGKTTCARIFAKTINCLNLTSEYEACNECESCVSFNEQRSYNIHELDAASNNSVDDIRSLIDQVRIPPQIGKYKVYIIDEVHMLSQAAFNSFLKTLEEPPAHAIFILATTEKHKIIPTILSRCQVYDFNRISVADIVNHLQYVASQENVTAEPEALNIIAQKADGGMRDALSIFDQTASYTAGNVTYKAVIENLNVLDFEYYFRLTDAILNGDVVNSLLTLNDILNRGFEGQYIISGISSHFRDLLVCKDPATAQLFEVGASIRERYITTAQRCDNLFLYSAIEIANKSDLEYRLSKNKRLLLELTFIKLCQLIENPNPATPQVSNNNIKPIAQSAEPAVETVAATSAQQPTPVVQTTQPTPSADNYQTPDVDAVSNPVAEPAQQVAVETKSPTKSKKSRAILGMGVSLASASNDIEEPTKVINNTSLQSNRNEPFTVQQLMDVWRKYANKLQEEVMLKNTMINSKLRLIDKNKFEVEVSTDINKGYLEEGSMQLMTQIRSELKNDDITMIIEISDAPIIEKPVTKRDLFDNFILENPTLQKLCDEFDLEIN